MIAYTLHRLAWIIPTLLIIFTINFFVIQLCPGGPVEQMIASISGQEISILDRLSDTEGGAKGDSSSESARYITPELRAKIVAYYGFDKPLGTRFMQTLKSYLLFDFGKSFYRDATVIDLILEKMPVSISLGIWTTLFANLIAIPLGIRKAIKVGSPFDRYSSFIVALTNAIPTFMIAILMIIFFAGGRYWSIFPLGGLLSSGLEDAGLLLRIKDYAWHMFLPVLAMVFGGIAGIVMLTRNSFMEEINKQYVTALRAKGMSEGRILYLHVFRNAMLIYLSGFPGMLLGMLFTGSLMVELIFSLDGLGLLGFEATVQRDFPVMLATLYISTLLGLLIKLLSDLTAVLVDPRIDFSAA